MQRLFVLLVLLLMMGILSQAQWTHVGLNNRVCRAFAVNRNDIFAGTDSGAYASIGGFINWSSINNSPMKSTYLIQAMVFKGNVLYAGTYGNGVFISSDAGMTWSLSDSSNVKFVGGLNVMAVCSDGSLLVGHSMSVNRSTDDGGSWVVTNCYGPTRAFVAIDSNVYAGSGTRGIYRSTDYGASWFSCSNTNTRNTIWSLAYCNGYVFANVTNKGIFRTQVGDTNWVAVNNGLPADGIGQYPTFVRLVTSGNNIFAGSTSKGVYLSADYGSSWHAVNEGLTDLDCRGLAIYDTTLLAGTYTQGIWSRPLSQLITDVAEDDLLPTNFSLKQNFPNPFNPVTSIGFQLPEAASVRLTLYDVLGQQVAMITSGNYPAGIHHVSFDGSNLTSGVYYYRIVANDFVQTKKMVLTK